MRGLTVTVYRPADPAYAACVKRGIVSGKFHTVLLIGEGVNGPTTIDDMKIMHPDYQPVMKLVRNNGRVYAIPVEVAGDGTGCMCFSGNFLHSCDSRFAILNNGLPIPCHDTFV